MTLEGGRVTLEGGPVDPAIPDADLTPFDRVRRRHAVTGVWLCGRFMCSLSTAVDVRTVTAVEDMDPPRSDRSYMTLRVRVWDVWVDVLMRAHTDAEPHEVLAELLDAATKA